MLATAWINYKNTASSALLIIKWYYLDTSAVLGDSILRLRMPKSKETVSMSLSEQLTDDLKQAMRSRDTLRRDVLRYLRAAVRNLEIERQETADDEAITGLLWRQARQRRDSIEAYAKGGRDDLVSKEEDELAIIMEYLPAELTDEEISEIASKAVDEVGATSPREMGKVMGRIIPQVEGRADLKKVSQTVAALLRERS